MRADSVERLYRGVPPEQKARLLSFRATHPHRQVVVAGTPWDYISCGRGREPLLILPGKLRLAEVAFPLIMALEGDCRLVVPSYPPVRTLTPLLEGVAGTLRAEGLARTAVLGIGYGGAIAQCFVRRYPDRVGRLILANTGLPPTADEVRPLSRLLPVLRLLPAAALRALVRPAWLRLLPAGEAQAFWRAYLNELLTCHLGKADILSYFEVAVDIGRHSMISPDDLAGWCGRILILESDDDLTSPTERAALGALYGQARRRTFHGGGHVAWLAAPEAYVREIKTFLSAS